MPLQSWRRSLPSLTGPWSWGHAWTAGCTHFGTALPGTACSTPCSRPPGASTTRTPCCARLCTTVYTTAPTGESGQQNPRAPTAPWGLCSSKLSSHPGPSWDLHLCFKYERWKLGRLVLSKCHFKHHSALYLSSMH